MMKLGCFFLSSDTCSSLGANAKQRSVKASGKALHPTQARCCHVGQAPTTDMTHTALRCQDVPGLVGAGVG